MPGNSGGILSKGTGPLSKLYNVVISAVDPIVPSGLRPLWLAPAGPRTVFFWGPLFKWTLVGAGFGDLINRPPHLISLTQCCVIAATGGIWSRYSLVIKPKNYNLFTVNVFVFLTQSYLIFKALKWRREQSQNTDYKHPQYPNWMEDDW